MENNNNRKHLFKEICNIKKRKTQLRVRRGKAEAEVNGLLFLLWVLINSAWGDIDGETNEAARERQNCKREREKTKKEC